MNTFNIIFNFPNSTPYSSLKNTLSMYIQAHNEVTAIEIGIELIMEHINSSENYLNDIKYDNNYHFFLLHKEEFREYVRQKNSINTDSLEEALQPYNGNPSINYDYKKKVQSYMFDFIKDNFKTFVSDHTHCEKVILNEIKYHSVGHDE